MTRPAHTPRTENANDRRGLAFAITAASGLGLAVAVSRLAYDGGTNGLTVAMTRSLVLVFGLFVFGVRWYVDGLAAGKPNRPFRHACCQDVKLTFWR